MVPVILEHSDVRHPVLKRGVPDQIEPVLLPLEFRGDDLVGLDRSDTECDEGRRDVDRPLVGLE